MDRKISTIRTELPNYIKIYADLIMMKHPNKMKDCQYFLSKKNLTSIDVIKLNEIIFGKAPANQKYRSYDLSTITSILEHQKRNGINNTELSRHYNVSRNTIKKWKETYNIK
jgi:hypothetical protein